MSDNNLIPDELFYTEDHTWLKLLDDFTIICGITHYLQEQLADIKFVEFFDIDIEVEAQEKLVELNSDRDIFHFRSPVSGIIITVNTDLELNPGIINTDPYNNGWILKIEFKDRYEIEDLMSPVDYSDFTGAW